MQRLRHRGRQHPDLGLVHARRSDRRLGWLRNCERRWRGERTRLHRCKGAAADVAVQEVEGVTILEGAPEQHPPRPGRSETEPQRRAPTKRLQRLDQGPLNGKLTLTHRAKAPASTLNRVERIHRHAQLDGIGNSRQQLSEELDGKCGGGGSGDEPAELRASVVHLWAAHLLREARTFRIRSPEAAAAAPGP